MAPSILVLSFSNLATDPRVQRQLRLLHPDCRVTAAGYHDPQLPGVEFVAIPAQRKTWSRRAVAALRLKLGRFAQYYWEIDSALSALAALRGRKFDLIIANDANTWPLAVALRGSARLLFDAHEYAPREFEDLRWWRVFHQPYKTWLCRENLAQADGVLTVCDGIADEYARVFGVRPLVVRNVPAGQSFLPRPTDPKQIRLIHHGVANPSRRLELMIDTVARLDERFTLDLMLMANDRNYLESLRSRAAANPRIRFRDSVPTAQIVPSTREYDIGVFLLPPTNFNYRFALPNKFFEFIQARLAVAIGPSPEMARLVQEHACGIVAENFSVEALQAALRPLTPERIDVLKKNAHRAAATLCWEHECSTLRAEVDRLLALGPWSK